MLKLTTPVEELRGVSEATHSLISTYVRDLLSEDHSVLLEEIGGTEFCPLFPESAEEILKLTDPDDNDNIVNRAFNVISDPLNTVFFVFTEPDRSKVISVYILKAKYCPQVFLRFIDYIHDDVDDEEDNYVPPYEVS